MLFLENITIFPTKGSCSVAIYVCSACGYIYDPADGDPGGGVPPGTAFPDIPDDWTCPVCEVGKEAFVIETEDTSN